MDHWRAFRDVDGTWQVYVHFKTGEVRESQYTAEQLEKNLGIEEVPWWSVDDETE